MQCQQKHSGLAGLMALSIVLAVGSAAVASGAQSPVPARAGAQAAYGNLPLSFEANRGQTDSRVDFLARGSGYTLFLTGDEAVLALRQPHTDTPSQQRDAVLRLQLLGVNTQSRIEGLNERRGKSNYFIGNDPVRWRTSVPTYAKVG